MQHEEKIVYTSRFGAIPESELARRNAEYEAEQKRRNAEAMDRLKKPARKLCPLATLNDFTTDCRVDKCALFKNGACVLSKLPHGETKNTAGKRCPMSGRRCTEKCILNEGGCIIAAAGKE